VKPVRASAAAAALICTLVAGARRRDRAPRFRAAPTTPGTTPTFVEAPVKKLTVAPLLALLVASVALTGCGKDGANPMAPSSPAPASGDEFSVERARAEAGPAPATAAGASFGVSRILFVHASPDAPAVDINLGWQPVARDLAFPNNTPYRYTWSGARTVKVNVANTATTVISARVTLAPRTYYSVFAVNEVAKIEPLVLVDDLTRPAPGNAHVRFIHLSPNAPAVDVALANGGPVVFGNRSFKNATAFTPLPAGTYDLEVRLAGTGTVVLPLPGITLRDGVIYTVFARGFVGGTGAQALGAQILSNTAARGGWSPFVAEPVADGGL